MQSGIAHDAELLHEVGVEVCGLVDTGTIFMLVNPTSEKEKTGGEAQINAIWSKSTLLRLLIPEEDWPESEKYTPPTLQVVGSTDQSSDRIFRQEDDEDGVEEEYSLMSTKATWGKSVTEEEEKRWKGQSTDFMFKNTYVKYDYLKFPKSFKTGDLTELVKRHMVQDVLTPFAILIMATGIEAIRQGYTEDDNLTPLLTQCLEL